MLLILVTLVTFISLWTFFKNKTKPSLDYWAKKGIVQLKGTDLTFGDQVRFITGGESVLEVFLDQYNEFKRQNVKLGGRYEFNGERALMVLDPGLLKQLLFKDFEFFMDHGPPLKTNIDPLRKNLFNLNGHEWRSMRHMLSPTFSSGKMKNMFQVIQMCTLRLTETLEDYANKKEPVLMQDILARFTTDVIGNCAFGNDCNSLKNSNDIFRQFGKRIFEPNSDLVMKLLKILPTKISEILHLRSRNPEVENFFMSMVKDNAEYREKNNIIRNDFFQLLLQLKNNGRLDDDQHSNTSNDRSTQEKLTIELMAAQCFVFFFAGFDTSSNTMELALYELAENPDIQDKLRKNINDILQKYDGDLTYDAIQEMQYLEKVIDETLRKYPVSPGIPRWCSKNYKIPNCDLVIEKGTMINIPVIGFHRDPDYYPDPLKFDPERFSKQNIESRPPMTYIPFGDGPRQCIGMRFAYLQSKAGLAAIIKNFRIIVNKEKSDYPLKLASPGFITSSKNLYFDVKKL